jgi:hypothetical protein
MSDDAETQFPPSYFAGLGSPSCSRWGKSEFEWIALAYVQALANDGDTWKPLTREQTYSLLTDEQKNRTHSQLTYDGYQYRFDAVSRQIDSAEGAFGVGGYWSRPRVAKETPNDR